MNGLVVRLTILSSLALALTAPAIHAQDKQGKQGLEQNRSRPKENQPAKTGAQRVQERTSERTQKALNTTGSAAQQEKTRQRTDKTLKKR